MPEFGGLWNPKNNQHALVSPKTESGCPSGGGIKNGHIRYPSLEERRKKRKKVYDVIAVVVHLNFTQKSLKNKSYSLFAVLFSGILDLLHTKRSYVPLVCVSNNQPFDKGCMMKTLFGDFSKRHFFVLVTLHCHSFKTSGPILIMFASFY